MHARKQKQFYHEFPNNGHLLSVGWVLSHLFSSPHGLEDFTMRQEVIKHCGRVLGRASSTRHQWKIWAMMKHWRKLGVSHVKMILMTLDQPQAVHISCSPPQDKGNRAVWPYELFTDTSIATHWRSRILQISIEQLVTISPECPRLTRQAVQCTCLCGGKLYGALCSI